MSSPGSAWPSPVTALQQLGEYLKLHPLAIEDAVQAHQRPKQERFGDVLAVAVKTLWFVEQTADVETGETMIFLGPSFALTVRHGANDPAVRLRAGWRSSRTWSGSDRSVSCTR
ncbi:CorA family divalent cation transporter [Streptomyces cinnamoneus]|uniref:CorA family divalent cation transporter n=1 Tax=Streptomyces cinnamoneus TaxID=53446 RepID=UPI001EFD67BD|nr:CorA family divalent cation transporter [Streptomyces cinnamoneus]